MRYSSKNNVLILGMFVLFLYTIFGTIYISEQAIPCQITPNTSDVQLHPRITIIGNTHLDVFCFGNGTDGLTPSTAYILKDYMIDANYSGSAIQLVILLDIWSSKIAISSIRVIRLSKRGSSSSIPRTPISAIVTFMIIITASAFA